MALAREIAARRARPSSASRWCPSRCSSDTHGELQDLRTARALCWVIAPYAPRSPPLRRRADRGRVRQRPRAGRRRAAGQRQLPGLAARGPGRVHGDDRHDRGDHAARPLQPEPRRPAARRRRGRAADLQGHAVRQDGLVRPRAAGRRRRAAARDAASRPSSRSTSGTRRTRRSRGSSTAAPTRGVDDLLLDVKGKKNYTIQVGGAAGAGGALTFKADFFPDTDGDGVLDDQLDKCKTVPGIERFGGCPPELKVVAEHRLRRQRRAGSRSSA